MFSFCPMDVGTQLTHCLWITHNLQLIGSFDRLSVAFCYNKKKQTKYPILPGKKFIKHQPASLQITLSIEVTICISLPTYIPSVFESSPNLLFQTVAMNLLNCLLQMVFLPILSLLINAILKGSFARQRPWAHTGSKIHQ